MKVKLLRDARIRHCTGEVATVSPEEGKFLISVGSAEAVLDADTVTAAQDAAATETKKRTTRKTK